VSMTWRAIFACDPTSAKNFELHGFHREDVVPAHERDGHDADTSIQGLTLVHFSAQRQRFLWDRGLI